ncbi:amidohydrolase family protein [Halalkalibacter oceani]|uniref:amidohydrolase family protein n=1 Tax=Halalkalibacter oceani TaxID=1653776 RepID=UPI0033925556
MPMYIKASWLFDSIDGTFTRDPVLTVEGDTIIELKFGEIEIPEGREVIDLDGCTLLPGFIDAHDHLSLSPQLENHPQLMNDPDPLLLLRGIENMKIDLASGITTSRCLGDKNFIDVYLKEAVEQGIVEGPRIVTCTRGIKASHAHGSVGTVFNGVEQIRTAVRENLLHGADFIKIFTTDTIRKGEFLPSYMTAAEIRVAVEEAHQVGKKVAAHAIGGKGLTDCITEGVDVIEHAYFADDRQIEEMIKQSRWVVLTPSIFFHQDRWNTVPHSVALSFQRNKEEVLDTHKRLLQSGVRYAVGTDATHGELAKDVIFLENIGEPLEKALQGITSRAAELCEMENSIGSLHAGKKADIVAVRGNVQADSEALLNVEWVMKDGKQKLS